MFHKVEQQILSCFQEAVRSYLRQRPPSVVEQELPKTKEERCADLLNGLSLDIPKEKGFGDLACAICLRLASVLGENPKSLAEAVVSNFKESAASCGLSSLVKSVQVRGAGFINIFLKEEVFFDLLTTIHEEADAFGALGLGAGRRVLIEFVSANPTGPLSVAHARQAAVGDSLARILERVGFEVTKEYYLNDKGNQINILGRSIELRYRQLQGETLAFPPECYQGQYIADLARGLLEDDAERGKIEAFDEARRSLFFRDFGVKSILEVIQKELELFGVQFGVWYSQKELEASGKLQKVLGRLRKQELLYDADGALWFKSSAFGDDKDRVVRKSDGSYTYLAPDIAYHEDKFRRGAHWLINIWGPDHHGYIPRIRAAVEALGKDREALSVIIVQLATLFRDGQPVPMSTRKGQYVTLGEVLTEVGRDASRFFFLMRKTDSHLDFDLELAKKQTAENPVYYIQYAHARIAGILNSGPQEAKTGALRYDLLSQGEERELLRLLFGFDYCLMACVRQLDPYPLTIYLQSLAAAFHRFYDKHKVLSQDEALSRSRLFLVRAVKIVLANGLNLLGIASPDRM